MKTAQSVSESDERNFSVGISPSVRELRCERIHAGFGFSRSRAFSSRAFSTIRKAAGRQWIHIAGATRVQITMDVPVVMVELSVRSPALVLMG